MIFSSFFLPSGAVMRRARGLFVVFLGPTLQQIGEMGKKDIAPPTHPDLFRPPGLDLSPADRPGNEPAPLAGAEFPGRTLSLHRGRAVLNGPAIPDGLLSVAYPGEEEKKLSFHMGRHASPTLFVTVDRFERGAEEFGQFPLGLVELFAQV
jgi:hypothetical protein